MDQLQFVSLEEYHNTLAAHLNITRQNSVLLQAIIEVLRQVRVLPSELLTAALSRIEAGPQNQESLAAIERLRNIGESSQDILKDYQGPIQ
jgi:hypothetical protein